MFNFPGGCVEEEYILSQQLPLGSRCASLVCKPLFEKRKPKRDALAPTYPKEVQNILLYGPLGFF